jgi:transposase InsO family protein
MACARLKLQHLRTRPYRPCTNGKAERFIHTLLREWVYVRPYRTSGQRARALPIFFAHHNSERPHGSLGGRRQSAGSEPGVDNVLRLSS